MPPILTPIPYPNPCLYIQSNSSIAMLKEFTLEFVRNNTSIIPRHHHDDRYIIIAAMLHKVILNNRLKK